MKKTKFNVIFISGVPGAGKTTLAEAIKKETDFFLIDDISINKEPFKDFKNQTFIIITDPYISLISQAECVEKTEEKLNIKIEKCSFIHIETAYKTAIKRQRPKTKNLTDIIKKKQNKETIKNALLIKTPRTNWTKEKIEEIMNNLNWKKFNCKNVFKIS